MINTKTDCGSDCGNAAACDEWLVMETNDNILPLSFMNLLCANLTWGLFLQPLELVSNLRWFPRVEQEPS